MELYQLCKPNHYALAFAYKDFTLLRVYAVAGEESKEPWKRQVDYLF
jgi:hypothetical protein